MLARLFIFICVLHCCSHNNAVAFSKRCRCCVQQLLRRASLRGGAWGRGMGQGNKETLRVDSWEAHNHDCAANIVCHGVGAGVRVCSASVLGNNASVLVQRKCAVGCMPGAVGYRSVLMGWRLIMMPIRCDACGKGSWLVCTFVLAGVPVFIARCGQAKQVQSMPRLIVNEKATRARLSFYMRTHTTM